MKRPIGDANLFIARIAIVIVFVKKAFRYSNVFFTNTYTTLLYFRIYYLKAV